MNRTIGILFCLAAAAVGVDPWVRAAFQQNEGAAAEVAEAVVVEEAESAGDEAPQRDEQETKPAETEPVVVVVERGYLSDWLKRAAEFVEQVDLKLPPPVAPQPAASPSIRVGMPDPLDLPSDEGQPTAQAIPATEPRARDPSPKLTVAEGEAESEGPAIFPTPLSEPTLVEAMPEDSSVDQPAREPTVAPPLFDTPASPSLEEEIVASPAPMFAAPLADSAGGETPRVARLPRADEPIKFPPLPPDPYAEETPKLPPLAAELEHRGGAHLYAPEGDAFQEHAAEAIACGHDPPKRLPEWFQAPQPCTKYAEYLGADPIQLSPYAWPGPGGYQWEPRFVLAGRYDVFGIAFEEGDQRFDGLGHNLTLDADLRLTGTERFHLQHRPIGKDNTGGSFYQFNDVDAYIDNSTAEPARFWFEGEFASIFSGFLHNPTQAWDVNFAFGKFPLVLHNSLLMNDEAAGLIIGNNNLQLGTSSNLNVRGIWLFDDIDSFDADGFRAVGTNVLGVDAFLDWRHAFIEATYAFRQDGITSNGDAHYLAVSGTQFFATFSATARAMAKIAGPAGSDGQLLVLEWNTHRVFDHGILPRTGIHHALAYANLFYATKGWSPIAGGNFNRIRSSFEVNPLVLIARGDLDDTPGVAMGVQLFGEGDDSSLTPEIAWEAPSGTSIFGAGLRYQRQTSVQSFLELRGLINVSDHSPFQRNGVFASHHWLF